jgi:hypothetical protein
MVKLYLRSRWPFILVIAYSLFAFALYAFNGMDIMIPCLWTTLTGVNCPGCGLTRALLLLFQFDFVGAWNMNPLIYLVAPALSYYIVKDFFSFRQRAHQEKSKQT